MRGDSILTDVDLIAYLILMQMCVPIGNFKTVSDRINYVTKDISNVCHLPVKAGIIARRAIWSLLEPSWGNGFINPPPIGYVRRADEEISAQMNSPIFPFFVILSKLAAPYKK